MELSRWENLLPIAAGLAVIAAIFQFPDESSGDETHRLAIGFLTVSAVWRLVLE